jgi:hypothetical protein
MRKFGSTT